MKRSKNKQVGSYPDNRPMYTHTMDVCNDGRYCYSTRAYRTLKEAKDYAMVNPVYVAGIGMVWLTGKVTASYKSN